MERNLKKVSIIVPVYNASAHLKMCLDSIVNQTYSNIEIVAINDGSTDDSLKILNDYKKKSKEKVVVYTQKNSGVATARNNGVELSTGDYITFMDNDDYITTDCIEKYVKNIKDNDMLMSGYIRKSYSNKILFKRRLKNGIITPYVNISCWAKLYKADFVKKNNFKFYNTRIGDEFYFNCEAYNKTDKIAIDSDTNYHWMFNDESLSNTDSQNLNRTDDLIDNLDVLHKEIKFKDKELEEYFYLRTLVYYLLFSCKKCPYDKILEHYKKMFDWLNTVNNKYHKNKYLNIFSGLNGEELSVKAILIIFVLLQRLHLDKLFLKVYSI